VLRAVQKRQLTLAPKEGEDNKGVLQAPSTTWKQIHPSQRGTCFVALVLLKACLLVAHT
jgi:hypothetical protein